MPSRSAHLAVFVAYQYRAGTSALLAVASAAAARALGDLAQACQAREGGGWWAGGSADVVDVLRKLAADDQDAVRLACVAALEKVAASPHQRGN